MTQEGSNHTENSKFHEAWLGRHPADPFREREQALPESPGIRLLAISRDPML
jgi:hypothetical protein